MLKNVFVYGTLMFSEVAEKVIGCSTDEKAELKEFKRYKIIVEYRKATNTCTLQM